MYLDRPMRDHNLLQAICRTNRPYPDKTYGLIVDYLGIFDDVAQALDFDEKEVQQVITNIEELKDALPDAMQSASTSSPASTAPSPATRGCWPPRSACPTTTRRDGFAAAYSYLARHWEALAPDPVARALPRPTTSG